MKWLYFSGEELLQETRNSMNVVNRLLSEENQVDKTESKLEEILENKKEKGKWMKTEKIIVLEDIY